MSLRALTLVLVVSFAGTMALTPFARRWLAGRGSAPSGGARAELRAPPEDVPAWTGEHAFADGSRVAIELTRLHADPDRQAFDAEAFARRGTHTPATVRLAGHAERARESEPFLCRLTWRAAPVSSRAAPGAAAAATDPVGIDLRGVRALDARGTAAEPTAEPSPAEDGRPADPLAVLVAAPQARLARDETVALVLFGRAPGAGARLALGDVEVELAATTLADAGLDRALARIGGKKRGSGDVEGLAR